MNSQNIAVCFGPVLLTQSQEPRRGGTGTRSYAHSEDIASAVDFKRHIEVLHYLLQAWPGEQASGGAAGGEGRTPVAPTLGEICAWPPPGPPPGGVSVTPWGCSMGHCPQQLLQGPVPPQPNSPPTSPPRSSATKPPHGFPLLS